MNIRTTARLWASLAFLSATACGSSGGSGSPDPTATSTTDLQSSDDESCKNDGAILPQLSPLPTFNVSTVPPNGDVNPYGVAFVPAGFPSGGATRTGDVLVANFNNSQNHQGTGTTIVRIRDKEGPFVFYEDDSVQGLSTALGVLERGFVLIGNVPSTDGSGVCVTGPNGEIQNVGQGALRILDRNGRVVRVLTSATLLDGPWDLTVDDHGSRASVFVSNVLTGTVTRLDLAIGDHDQCDDYGNPRVEVLSETQIASGYLHRCDVNAFVVGPTGLALDSQRDVLYVASTGDNNIYAVEDAHGRRDHGMGRPIVRDTSFLRGPLGMVRANNGNLISAQGDAVNGDPNFPSEIVEVTARGRFVFQFSLDPAQGSAFGVALEENDRGGFRFAAVNDDTNKLEVWKVR